MIKFHSNVIFATKHSIKTAMRVHERKTQFKCGICDKKYEGKRALTVHIRTIHGGKKLLKCGICDKKYSTEAHLKRHIATIHIDENP